MALPRIPRDVIFVIGGWHGCAKSVIETYDIRVDRWSVVPHDDPAGPRGYFGTAVHKFKIYCIGGYDGERYFNMCREFDAKHLTWQEVSIKIYK